MNSYFIKNYALNDAGGAIYLDSIDLLILDMNVFKDNNASIASYGGALSIERCKIS